MLSRLRKLIWRSGHDEQPTDGNLAEAPLPDRRRWPRVKLQLQVRLRFVSPEAAIDSHTFDISSGGVFIAMPQPRPEGTTVRLILDIGDRTLVLGGVVMRVVPPPAQPCGIGVAFTEISAHDEQFLADLVLARRARHR